MKSQTEVLAALIGHLEAIGIPHMLTGSFASSIHGRPRTTHDADLVIEPTAEGLQRLVEALAASGFYVDQVVAMDALRLRRQFNVIDMGTAFKLDLIIRKERPFSRQEFSRRFRVDLPDGVSADLATPEDTILSKLEWAKKGGSERQLEDARGVVEVRGTDLDRDYVERWARELDVLELWRRITS